MRARPAIALLLVALLSGCVAEDGTPIGDAPGDIPAGEAPAGTNAGSAASHGSPQRTESDVTVTSNGGNHQARKTVTITNDFGGATAADVSLSTHVGGVSAADWGEGGYKVVATLSASGDTEQEARSRLAQMKVTHSESLSNGRLVLRTDIPSGPGGGGISVHLPPEPSYRLTMGAGTGGLAVEGLGGSVLTMDTGTGGIVAAGAFNTATLSADTGGIELEGTYNTLRVLTDVGGVSGTVTASASGTHTYDVGTGGIDVRLTGGADHGYDVEASVGTGSVDIDLDDGTDVGTQSRTHKHVRTAGYDAKAVRVKLTAEAGIGGIDITG